LVVVCLLASNAAASSRWTITSGRGITIALDVTRTPLGYDAFVHEQKNVWQVNWAAIPCPEGLSTAEYAAGAKLMTLKRQTDGTFTVEVNKALLLPIGGDGPGTDPVVQCQLVARNYTAKLVDRARAAGVDAAAVAAAPASHNTFLLMEDMRNQPCPIPDSAKRTCLVAFNPHTVVDVSFEDSDGDGLNDEWEVGGVREGTEWLDLKSMGADPEHKDLFIQMDSSDETKFPDDVLHDIRLILDNVPISNPDGHNGIHLHLDTGPSSVMDTVTNHRWGSLSDAQTLSATDAEHFSSFPGGDCPRGAMPDEGPIQTLYQRNLKRIRQKVFRYVAVVKYLGPSTDCFSGMNWTIQSKYFVVADFSSTGKFSSPMIVGTFLHELGHSIGLRHGGYEDTNFKPNYQSVMNYAYQLTGIWAEGQGFGVGSFGFSAVNPAASNQIDETTLDEQTGFPPGSAIPHTQLTYKCGADLHPIAPHVPTDFDCDNDRTMPAPNDVTPENGIGATLLKTFNDATHMHLELDVGAPGSAGARTSPETLRTDEALKAVGAMNNDKKDPTVKLSLRKQRGKRILTIKAHDDVGLASAMVSTPTKKLAVSLSTSKKFKKDANVSVDVDLTGDVTVIVNDIANKSVTATAK
jgi:hypothetical protein